jgi:hypothetical protein
MKTIVNGVEITQKITDVLTQWYDTTESDPETRPEIYVRWLSDVQDSLTRILLDLCKVDQKQIEKCVGRIIYIKDELQCFIPESANQIKD